MADQVALVTGASSGIGEATALALHRAGFTVYAAARRVDRMASLVAQGVRAVSLDVTDEDCMKACVQQILDEQGRIDALVNNAGYGSYGAVEDVPMEEAQRQVEVNLFGLARMTQLVLPTMRKQRSGTIVNVSSIGGKTAGPFGGWYHATKFAVEGLSDSLRQEVRPFGIRVVVIEPGGVASEWAGIAADSLRKTSGSGPYASHATRMAEAMSGRLGNRQPPPSVVADPIVKAIQSDNPRTRYHMGLLAGPMLVARRLLSDRAMDALTRRFMA